ncbi:MAG: cob(I)yrinic acid a,c-diamide adenosyltransferase [Gammaproteobacteria bacterium]
MGHRLSKITTRTGDDGTTGLGDGSRVKKDALCIDVMGDVDELNSLIGVLCSYDIPDDINNHLLNIQHALFDLGGELSIPDAETINTSYIESLEDVIESYNQTLPPLEEFILPGGHASAAICHLARAVCRRAERHLVGLSQTNPVNDNSQKYLNRLSDLLFVFARVLVRQGDGQEILWDKDRM